MFKYGVVSGLYFSVFGLNTGKYGPEITPYLDTFRALPLLEIFIFCAVIFVVMKIKSCPENLVLQLIIRRRCCPQVFYKKILLENIVKFIGRHLQWSPIFSKVSDVFI